MKVAILGVGTVGSGVIQVIQNNQDKIQKILGEPLTVTHAFVRDKNKPLPIEPTTYITTMIEDIYESDVDVVVETMGGVNPAREYIATLLRKGKHVVTANKELLAHHLDELTAIANQHDTLLLYEASVAGGIPLLNTLEIGLAANDITEFTAILNGTSNYILSKMDFDGWSYQHALQKAQEAGFAEADPTNDVEGFDVRYKAAILSRLAFNRSIQPYQIETTGITQINDKDVQLGNDLKLKLKLIAKGKRFNDGSLSIYITPMMLTEHTLLSNVHYAQNGIILKGNAVGEVALLGPGAGGLETASAVVSDIMQINQRRNHPTNFVPSDKGLIKQDKRPLDYYTRFENPEHIQTILHTLDLPSITQVEIKQEGVVLFKELPFNKRLKLQQTNELAAIYQIEGD